MTTEHIAAAKTALRRLVQISRDCRFRHVQFTDDGLRAVPPKKAVKQ